MTDTAEHVWLPEPDLAAIDVSTALQALAEPVRLEIVRQLGTTTEYACGSFDLQVNRSTISHHLRVLRESGIVSTRLAGTTRLSRLRTNDLAHRFPGLLDALLNAAPAAASNM